MSCAGAFGSPEETEVVPSKESESYRGCIAPLYVKGDESSTPD